MEINQIKDMLALLTEITVSEMEQSGSSKRCIEEFNYQMDTLPEDIKKHFSNLWSRICRASEAISRKVDVEKETPLETYHKRVLSLMETVEKKFGYEYLCSWIPEEGIKETEELLSSLPEEVAVFRDLNNMECALAGEKGEVPYSVWEEYSILLKRVYMLLNPNYRE